MCFLAQEPLVRFALAVVFLLERIEAAQPFIPVGLEGLDTRRLSGSNVLANI
jgi:hypothetical protein